MQFGTARAFLVYAGVDGLLLLAFFLFWGLSPNDGQRRDTSLTGDAEAGAPAATSPPPLVPAVTPASPLQNQTFTTPTAAESNPSR